MAKTPASGQSQLFTDFAPGTELFFLPVHSAAFPSSSLGAPRQAFDHDNMTECLIDLDRTNEPTRVATGVGLASPVMRPRPLHIGTVVVDPPILQAPMAGFTNYAFRQIVREYGGVGLQATEMVSARSFVWLGTQAEHPDRLWGVADEPRPLAVQMWDNDPETLARVGERLANELRVSVVDINFGCPVKDVTEKAHSGSYLLRHPDRVGRIIEKVVAACRPTPVTAKIRLGCSRNSINAIEIAKTVEAAGAAALTVHGRTAQDFFKGAADWERIAEIKPHLSRIPLIGNGDLDSADKVVEAFLRYGVDGVMIARACLGRPWLFRQAQAALMGEDVPPDPTPLEQRDCLVRHFRLVIERFGESKGVLLMRKYACCYAQGKPGAREFRRRAALLRSAADFFDIVENYFPLQNQPAA
jgi:tRNA-dihydrouridine synthase B